MASNTCVFILMCIGLLETWLPKTSAWKQSSHMCGLMAEKRARMRQDEVREALNNEYANDMDRVQGWPEHKGNTLPWPAEETVADLIVFYANMIRNEANLLDNSVPNRMQKTGNVKVKKEDQSITDDHCKCEKSIETVDLTKDWGIVYPYIARNVTCSDNCAKPYTCKAKIYNMTVVKRRPQALTLNLEELNKLNRGYAMPLPKELARHWAPAAVPLTVGCYCTLP